MIFYFARDERPVNVALSNDRLFILQTEEPLWIISAEISANGSLRLFTNELHGGRRLDCGPK